MDKKPSHINHLYKEPSDTNNLYKKPSHTSNLHKKPSHTSNLHKKPWHTSNLHKKLSHTNNSHKNHHILTILIKTNTQAPPPLPPTNIMGINIFVVINQTNKDKAKIYNHCKYTQIIVKKILLFFFIIYKKWGEES